MNPATQFEELYLAEFPKIFYKIKKIVYDRDIALELTHDTFIKAYTHRLTYKPLYPPNAWLSRIGHNAAISYLRHEKHKDMYVKRYKEDIFIDPSNSNEAKILIGKAMRFLNKEQREVIKLYYFDDLTDQMIAEKLGISHNSVLHRRHSALEKMREELV